jgi:hypothetical protein
MGIQKVTFDGANVTSRVDADLNHYLFSKDVGILKGFKQECSFTLANNTITFQDGYASIHGRIVYIENQTTVSITPDSSKFGYVVLAVDTTNNTVQIYAKEAVGTYPTLTRTDLQTIEGVYELALCAYQKTTTSVTLIAEFERQMITSDKVRVDELEEELRLNYYPFKLTLTKISNGVYRFGDVNSVELSQSIMYVVIENTSVVSFPGQLLFLVVGSNTSVGYRYAGADYSLSISYVSGLVTLSCGNTAHRVTSAFIKK